MSEVELTQRAGGGGVNPSFTATGIFPSGLDASGPVDMASAFAASGIEASALIKGTIGNFLATAIAGSGFNASGPSKFTTMSGTDLEISTINGAPPITGNSITLPSGITACALASFGASAVFTSGIAASGAVVATSGDFASGMNVSGPAQMASIIAESGINTSALVQVGGKVSAAGSGIFMSGLSAPDLEVSTINGSPPGTTTSTFSSGLTVCALLSVGSIMIANASATFLSAINTSGQLAVGTSILASGDLDASAVIARGNLSVNGPAVFASQVQAISGGFNTSTLVTASQVVTVNLSVNASGAFVSGLNTSGLAAFTSINVQSVINLSGAVAATSVLVACTLTVSGLTSLGGSLLVDSGIRTSGGVAATSNLAASGSILTGSVLYASGSIITGADLFASGSIIAQSMMAASGSVIVGSNLYASGDLLVGGSLVTVSGIFTSGPAQFTSPSTVVDLVLLMPTGQTSANFTISGVVGGAGLVYQIDASGNVTNSGKLSVGGSVLGQSGATFGGLVSATSFVGAFAFTSVNAASGGTFSALLSQGASILVACTLAVSGLTSLGGSLVVASVLQACTTVHVGGSLLVSQTVVVAQNFYASNGSAFFGSALTDYGNFLMSGNPSTLASAGSAVFMLWLPTGAQASYAIAVSVGGTQIAALTTCGLLSVNSLGTSTETVGTLLSVGGSILGQSGATFSGLVSATSFVGAFVFTSVNTASGGTWSALLSQGASILVGCTLAVSGFTSLGGCALIASDVFVKGIFTVGNEVASFGGNINALSACINIGSVINFSGAPFAMMPPSFARSAGSQALISVTIVSGAQASYLLNFSVGNSPGLFLIDVNGQVWQSGTLNVGASILGQSGATFSGLVSATSFVGAFAITSIDAASGGTLSGLLSIGASTLIACTLAVSGLVSAPSIAVTTLSGLNVTTSTETAATLLSVGGSILGQSGATFSGLVSATSFVGAFAFTSVDAASGGTFSALFSGVSILVACTLAVSGFTSFGGSAAFASGFTTSAKTSIGGNLNVESGVLVAGNQLTASAILSVTGSGAFQSGLNTSGAVVIGGNLSIVGSMQAASGIRTCAIAAIHPPSTIQSAGGLAYLSVGATTGAQASYFVFMSVGNNPLFAFNLSGTFSALAINVSTINGAPPGTTTSTFSSGLTACALLSVGSIAIFNASATFLSIINTSGAVVIGGNLSVIGSMQTASGMRTCGILALHPPSTVQSAGSLAYVSIGVPTGTQASYLFNFSLGNTPGQFLIDLGGQVWHSGALNLGQSILASGDLNVSDANIRGKLSVAGSFTPSGNVTNTPQGWFFRPVLILSGGSIQPLTATSPPIIVINPSIQGCALTKLALPSADTVSGVYFQLNNWAAARSVVAVASVGDNIDTGSIVNIPVQGARTLYAVGSGTWTVLG